MVELSKMDYISKMRIVAFVGTLLLRWLGVLPSEGGTLDFMELACVIE